MCHVAARSVATFLLISLFLTGQAWAQPEEGETTTPEESETTETQEVIEEAEQEAEADIQQVTELFQAEPVEYQVTFPRVFLIHVPAFLLDAFFDMHANTWSEGQTNFAFGGEFIIRRLDEYDLVFSLDWTDLRTTDDWWKEEDKIVVDADWGENTLSLITVDVAINWMTVINEYWHLYYGLGLGVALVLGDFLKTDVDPACIVAAGFDPFDDKAPSIVREHCTDDDGNPRLEPGAEVEEEDSVPPLLPALSFTFGSRWIISENWVIQLELGLKTGYLYTGLEFGYTWR